MGVLDGIERPGQRGEEHRHSVFSPATIPSGTQSTQIIEGELTADEVFSLLSNGRRREVLRYLLSRPEETVALDELAVAIAAKENRVTTEEVTSTQRRRVYVGLYQCHLPTLAEKGVIQYDRDAGEISLGNVSALMTYLPSEERDQSYRLTPALLGGSILIIGVLGMVEISIFGMIPGIAWGVGSLLSLLALVLFCSFK